jgi:glutathione peroxidase
MTIKQRILRFTYQWLMKLQQPAGRRQVKINAGGVMAPVPFYALRGELTDGSLFDFSILKGKNVLLVNVASECGFTAQYEELETLYRQYNNNLVVLGFPSNDFKGQEPGTDAGIASFCKTNFGVTFPLFKKQPVLSPPPNSVYAWLSDEQKNGWNKQQPTWNFCKYLVDREGRLAAFFPATVSPLSEEVVSRVEG